MPTRTHCTPSTRSSGGPRLRIRFAIFGAALLFGSGCASPEGAASDLHSSDAASLAISAGRGAEDVQADVEALSSIDFDNCCVDLSHVTDCRSGPNARICIQYRRSGTTKLTCKKQQISCPAFKSYECYNHGVAVTGGLPCCSGSAAYNGSALYCK